MKQNKYDDPAFFANYSQMARSIGGLDAAGEWPAFRELLPKLRDKNVLDLGCGFGWHCRYAREQQARSVVGVDISEKMLARARESTNDSAIEYRRLAIEDIDFSAGEFDVVLSSLALHYVEHFDVVCRKIHHCLQPGGIFVLSVEHPIFTALAAQDWYYGQHGERLHWPVDHYQKEGPRQARFLDHDVVKYHRTVATYVNTLIDSGFTMTKLAEPQPTQELLDKDLEWQDETRRPMFLLIAGVKNEQLNGQRRRKSGGLRPLPRKPPAASSGMALAAQIQIYEHSVRICRPARPKNEVIRHWHANASPQRETS